MALIIGTDTGLVKFAPDEGTCEPLLDTDAIYDILLVADDRLLTATETGITAVDVDRRKFINSSLAEHSVTALYETATVVVYAGTQSAHLLRSPDGGGTWQCVSSFEEIPGKGNWTQNHMGPAKIRAIQTHEHAPARVHVAVETAGHYLTLDGGTTWESRSVGLDNDPHGLQVVGPESLIATCGRGLYRTDSTGRRWYRLDTHHDHFWYQYFRAGLLHNGVYYTCVMDRSTHRFKERNPGRILTSPDGGTTLQAEEYPGDKDDYVNAWAVSGDTVFAGTVGGQLLKRNNRWEQVLTVDSSVRALTAV